MKSIEHAAPARLIHGVARLVSPLVDFESLAAVLEHLGHKRQAVQAPLVVKCAEDFLFTPNFDPITASGCHISLFTSDDEALFVQPGNEIQTVGLT